jgi:hypothetical protein
MTWENPLEETGAPHTHSSTLTAAPDSSEALAELVFPLRVPGGSTTDSAV